MKTKNYIYQYKVLFYFSWICLYLIFPAWISSHTLLQNKGFIDLSNPLARSTVVLGFIVYFFISAYFITRYFSTLIVDKPVIIKVFHLSKNIKSNLSLIIVCCLAVFLHIGSFSKVSLGFLAQGLWMYDLSNIYWHRLFELPIQYGFWSVLSLLILLIKQKITFNSISNFIIAKLSLIESSNLVMFLVLFFMYLSFSLYSISFSYSLDDSLPLLRFPPVSHYLYLLAYYAFGVSQMGPKIIQFIFYILGAVYLFRTIHLFREKENALLGAAIYLFSPVIFYYASLTFLESGTTFFMILISFHFLKYITYEENRDLILTTYFIGIGFLYSRIVLVVFIICFAYLIFDRIKKRDWHSNIDFKILIMSMIFVLPFLMIGGRSGQNFYDPALSNLMSWDFIFLVIQSQLSFVLSILLLISIGFIIVSKKNDLTLYYGLYFIVFYVFLNLKLGNASQRYTTALYPAIAVLLAHLIFRITQLLRYKHFLKLSFSILICYLIFLCLIPRSSSSLTTFKYKDFESQQYPVEKATEWIRVRTSDNEKILAIMPAYYEFYIDRIYADKDEINNRKFIYYRPSMNKVSIYPLQSLIEYCYAENISYIMFLYGPKNSPPDLGASYEVKYLEENRNHELIDVTKFNYEDNYIYIYKLKEPTYIWHE